MSDVGNKDVVGIDSVKVYFLENAFLKSVDTIFVLGGYVERRGKLKTES